MIRCYIHVFMYNTFLSVIVLIAVTILDYKKDE